MDKAARNAAKWSRLTGPAAQLVLDLFDAHTVLAAAKKLLAGIEATARALRASVDAVRDGIPISEEIWSSKGVELEAAKPLVEMSELNELSTVVMAGLEEAERADLATTEAALAALTLLPGVQDAWRLAIRAVVGVRSVLGTARTMCERHAATTRHTLEAGFDEGILSLCRPISLLYGESL